MGKSKAPEYATASYNTDGLFGSSTTSGKSTNYTAPDWMKNTMGTVGGNVNTTLQNLISGDFANDPNYQAYQNNLNRQMSQSYDANVLGQLANRGLMRSSGLQAATNAFADTLANNQMNLYDNYYNRQANNLSNLLNTSNTLYNYITGINTGSQNLANNVSNYNLNKAQLDAAGGSSAGNILSGAMNGAMAGAATGNPYAALGGAVIGGVGGALR